jgi:hypothetical protein
VSEVDATAQPASEPSVPTGFRGLPRWLRIGIIAAGAAVLLLVVVVLVRMALQAPHIPLGTTAADKLQSGSCLLEPGDLESYTVVSCGSPHQQQVVASVDLAYPGVEYHSDDSLAIYAGSTCDRLLEYRLFFPSDLIKADYNMLAINPPTLDRYTSGDTRTLCAVLDDPDLPKKGGHSVDLTSDLYRPIPQ